MLRQLRQTFRRNPGPSPVVVEPKPHDYVVPRSGVPLERTYCQQGFTVLPEVFSASEVGDLRQSILSLFPDNKPPYEARFSNSALCTSPFRGVFENAKLIDSLRRLFGNDFVFLNEFGVHDSNFSGWHADTSSPEGKAGHDFHWAPTFMVTNVAIYLNDNTDNGSGLDVVPGSYAIDDPLAKSLRAGNGFPVTDYTFDEAAYPYHRAVTLRTKAGDVAMFNLRTRHRSSLATKEARNNDERKLAMFLIVGPNNDSTRRYARWLDEYAAMTGATRHTLTEEFRDYLHSRQLAVL